MPLVALLLPVVGGGGGGAVAQLAAEVAQAAPPRGALRVAVRGPGRLGVTVEEIAVGKLRERGRVVNPPAGGADFTLELSVALVERSGGARVSVEGSVRATGAEIWRRATGAGADTIGRVFAEAAADAESRLLAGAPAPQPVTYAVHQIPLPESAPILALAVGDLVGQGRPQLVGLTERDVIAWSIDLRAGAARELRRLPLAQPPAARAPRTPLGALVVPKPGAVTARLYDRAQGLGVSAFPLGRLPGGALLLASLDPQNGCYQVGPPWPARLHGAAAGPIGRSWAGAAVDAEGQLVVFRGAPGQIYFTAAGAGDQVAIYDANGDEDPEVATSAFVPPGEDDQIVVRGARGELWRSPSIGGSVTALAAGDALGDGRVALVAAVRLRASGRTELWVIE